MKKLLFLILTFLIVGCSKIPSKEIPTIDLSEPVTDSKDDYYYIIDELETMYNATLFDKAVEECEFTADIIDKYKGKNIISNFYDVEDIFYFQDIAYLYAESHNAGFQLQLNDEQYQKIKKLRDEEREISQIIFELTDVQVNYPNVDMELTIDIYTPDDIESDFYSNTVYNFRLVKGVVVDIIES